MSSLIEKLRVLGKKVVFYCGNICVTKESNSSFSRYIVQDDGNVTVDKAIYSEVTKVKYGYYCKRNKDNNYDFIKEDGEVIQKVFLYLEIMGSKFIGYEDKVIVYYKNNKRVLDTDNDKKLSINWMNILKSDSFALYYLEDKPDKFILCISFLGVALDNEGNRVEVRQDSFGNIANVEEIFCRKGKLKKIRAKEYLEVEEI